MKKILLLSTLTTFSLIGTAALAQGQIKNNALEKVHYYHAPREIQILDERPVVRDFREAPEDPGSIQLPPGPSGNGGGNSGGPGGGAGNDPGSSLPSGGMQIGGGGQGYRTPPRDAVPLGKSGFGGPSNIPAGGMGSRTALPTAGFGPSYVPAKGLGVNTPLSHVTQGGVLGRILSSQPKTGASAGAARGITPRRAAPPPPPAVSSYSGGYGSRAAGSGSHTATIIRGSILNNNKHN